MCNYPLQLCSMSVQTKARMEKCLQLLEQTVIGLPTTDTEVEFQNNLSERIKRVKLEHEETQKSFTSRYKQKSEEKIRYMNVFKRNNHYSTHAAAVEQNVIVPTRLEYYERLRKLGLNVTNEVRSINIPAIHTSMDRLSREGIRYSRVLSSSLGRMRERLREGAYSFALNKRAVINDENEILQTVERKMLEKLNLSSLESEAVPEEAAAEVNVVAAASLVTYTEDLVAARFEPPSHALVDQFNKVLSSSSRDPDTVVMNKYSIEMNKYKVSCLRPSVWLNDEVISFYMCMLQER
jgi:hypothetical protein